MKAFFFNTDDRLKEIFKDHCDLSQEQYLEIRAELTFLVCDYQEEEQKEEIEKSIICLKAVADFLYNTRVLTLKEHNDLYNLVDEIKTEGEKEVKP